ncbi:S-linalool synthase [Handroanthus impetiginosus]|uniref:S-linalool synthase n=1 Tax=Handroanthus impetiginosus TaxID=429701 RepID=A0A2G9GJV9_9LAMI|nr:S-linalool synthase [Handroanthus impetiginosus]
MATQLSNGTITEETFLLKYTQKSEEVRDMISKVERDHHSLILIDTIQRLGLGYLFEDELEAILHQQFLASKSAIYDLDLYKAALCFRLLRQQGYQVRPDCLIGDTKGLMELHEASHLSMEGEDILHEAAEFSSRHLNAKLASLNDDDDDEEAKIVIKDCLLYPQHKSLPRFKAKNFLDNLNGDNEWEILLQELANLEFSLVESSHKDEILQVVRWWKGLGLSKELKSSRDQPLKWHMWSKAILCEPTWSKQRTLLTKPISLVYAVDDIFDLYGTMDQLTVFTEAVIRWDISAAENLPNYMKICFAAIYDTTYEICSMVFQEYGWNPIDTLRKEWGRLFNAFLVEAKWFTSGELQKSEVYLENGVVSSGVPVVLSHLFFLMGAGLTKETEVLLSDSQGISYSVAKILRLLDDLGTAQDEHQEGYDGSYVECYMKEKHVHSLEDAHEHVKAMVSET